MRQVGINTGAISRNSLGKGIGIGREGAPPTNKCFPFSELMAMTMRSLLKRSGSETAPNQKCEKRRNEMTVKVLKSNDSAKWLIRLRK
jgi:hypothetical protein